MKENKIYLAVKENEVSITLNDNEERAQTFSIDATKINEFSARFSDDLQVDLYISDMQDPYIGLGIASTEDFIVDLRCIVEKPWAFWVSTAKTIDPAEYKELAYSGELNPGEERYLCFEIK